ncbi:glycosyltransferase family 4 protein [Aquibacillus albus]|uniref:Glycosyltransferase involved in cell wall biosynthesis n=1 Tax=Aquibacillus albus TaxID=1168171 RepID=A0ABS2N5U2_9BACI|nr:glycosyltransferase family 4 protein [Aquibacillus albus]MBM7573506.1 glycosyltransferase involved in cell wall biosynthesis [Aquibacillus albus]
MKNKKRIVFVINYFYPDLASTGQLMTDLCSELQYEYEITVIAAQPGYAGEDNYHTKKISVKFYQNIKVISVKLPSVNKNKKISRLKYITTYFLLSILMLIRQKDVDVIYTISQPPILGGLIGTIGKFILKAKHIYNIQDFNPEQASIINFLSNKLILRFARFLDNLNCRLANEIVLVGEDMVETLLKRFKGRYKPSYSVINNWIDEKVVIPLSNDDEVIKKFKNYYKLNNKFIVMYSGNLGLYYDLENIIKITKEFSTYSNIMFVFIGEGAIKSQLLTFVNDNGLENVLFLPYQAREFIKYSLNIADIHLVVNQKGIKGISVPSKIYGVMAVGKPILGVLENGSEAERLINKSQCGFVVEPQNYEEIKTLILKFYNMDKNELNVLGKNGRYYLERHLRKEISINKYRDIIKSV